MKRKMPLYGKWFEWEDGNGDAGRAVLRVGGPQSPAVRVTRGELAELTEHYDRYERNRLAYFLPHGLPWSDQPRAYGDGDVVVPPSQYDKRHGNDGVAFVNDRENNLVLLLAPRKVGKSTHGVAKVCLNLPAVECDPTWQCFTHGGVDYHEFEGPKTVVVASFAWTNVAELWQVYLEFLPRDELGPFAPNWGRYDGETGRQRQMSFGDGKPKSLSLTRSGTRLIFLCYSQDSGVWENFKSNALHADEQIKQRLLTAWQDGTRTMGAYTPAYFTMSGFKLDERPDTGAAGYVKRELWDLAGKLGESRRVGRYNMDIESTPESVMVAEKKREAFDKYINPDVDRTDRDRRRGMACYWPGWELGGGLMLEEWDRRVHLIPPLWDADGGEAPPADAMLFRSADHGDKSPMACWWVALLPARNPWTDYSFAVAYRLHYRSGERVALHAKTIIEASGGAQVRYGSKEDMQTGDVQALYEERLGRERFVATILDGRSMRNDKGGSTVAELYARYGLEFQAARGGNNVTKAGDGHLQMLKDWMRVNRSLRHPTRRDRAGRPLLGGSQLYFFDSPCMQPWVSEVESFRESDDRPEIAAPRQEDHAIDALKYWASFVGPSAIGWLSPELTEDERERREQAEIGSEPSPFTGY
jgi:hypothetical protein